jgi:multiple sugar transport system ATP-binding protein
MASLRIKNLTKSFGNVKVINGISFEVSEGEFCILLGPSGCGKTTILRLIAGLEEQDEGEIYIDEREVSNLPPRQRDVTMVFQSYALYPHMSVYENIAFPLRMRKERKEEIDKRVRDTAGLLGIGELLKRKPKELSGGQRQRVAIGRALVRNPRLFLFDEPLSNLDAKLRASMRVELAKLHQKLKATMVYVTHDQVEAMTLGEKIIIIDKGVIQQIGSPRDVYERPSNIFVATFIGIPQINLLEGRINNNIFESGEISIDLSHYRFSGDYTGRPITMGIRPESLRPEEGPLQGRLELIEHLGPETIIHVRVGDKRLIAKAPPDYKVNAGEPISLSIGERGVHFFYEGKRLSQS